MKQRWKRYLSAILALVLCLSLCGFPALAEEFADGEELVTAEETETEETGEVPEEQPEFPAVFDVLEESYPIDLIPVDLEPDANLLLLSSSSSANVINKITSYVSGLNGSFSTSYLGKASGCAAFSNYVWKNVFGYDWYAGKHTRVNSGSASSDVYGFLSNNGAKAGDNLWCYQKDSSGNYSITHNMIVLDYDSTGIWMCDGSKSGSVLHNGSKVAYTSSSYAKYFNGSCVLVLYKIDSTTWNKVAQAEEHTHSYSSSVTSPTCTTQGYTTHTCSCGASYVDSYTSALGHNWDSGTVTTAATCTTTGVRTYTCTRCSAKTTSTISATGHNYYLKSKKEATLTATGYYEYKCSNCGATYKTTIDALTSVSGNCGDNVTWTLNQAGELTISGTGEMYEKDTNLFGSYAKNIKTVVILNGVTSIGHHAFIFCSNLTSITIPNSVTSIGYNAFYDCFSLTNITIGNGVTSIGDFAFNRCTSLTSITIPNSVTSIGYDAFGECTSLTNITIGNGVTSIGDWAFCDCNSLTSIDIPNSVTSIGDAAFQSCDGLTSITIPNSVTSIGDQVFYYCYSLTGVTIGNSVTSIGNWAFGNCTNLTSIDIPNSVTDIGSRAFKGCYSMKNIQVSDGNLNYCSLDGVLFDKLMTTLIKYPGAKTDRFVIPNSVVTIGEDAFYDCEKLTDIYYQGNESQWSSVSIGSGNTRFDNVTMHFVLEKPEYAVVTELSSSTTAKLLFSDQSTATVKLTSTVDTNGDSIVVGGLYTYEIIKQSVQSSDSDLQVYTMYALTPYSTDAEEAGFDTVLENTVTFSKGFVKNIDGVEIAKDAVVFLLDEEGSYWAVSGEFLLSTEFSVRPSVVVSYANEDSGVQLVYLNAQERTQHYLVVKALSGTTANALFEDGNSHMISLCSAQDTAGNPVAVGELYVYREGYYTDTGEQQPTYGYILTPCSTNAEETGFDAVLEKTAYLTSGCVEEIGDAVIAEDAVIFLCTTDGIYCVISGADLMSRTLPGHPMVLAAYGNLNSTSGMYETKLAYLSETENNRVSVKVGGKTAILKANHALTGTVFVASYDANGKLLSVQGCTPAETITAARAGEAATVKVMWVDENLSPVCSAVTLTW